MSQIVILVTGAREVPDMAAAELKAQSLLSAELAIRNRTDILVVHGGAVGWDTAFETVADNMAINTRVFAVNDPQFNPRWYQGPLSRNDYMAKKVAHWQDNYGIVAVCWSFANAWASGTGHCARRARHHSIMTIDYGVSTDYNHRYGEVK